MRVPLWAMAVGVVVLVAVGAAVGVAVGVMLPRNDGQAQEQPTQQDGARVLRCQDALARKRGADRAFADAETAYNKALFDGSASGILAYDQAKRDAEMRIMQAQADIRTRC